MVNREEIDNCSVIEVAHILGKKWTIPIVEEIYSNYSGIHFNGLLNSIEGITVCMLSRELHELHEEGFLDKAQMEVNRTVYINYRLTKKGILLAELIDKAKEFCMNCCAFGEECKYSRRRHVAAVEEDTTIISESRQYI